MKIKNLTHLFLPFIILCSGCASLTKTQLGEVNAFGQMTSHFSAYPGTILTTYNRIHQQQELLKANSESNPEAHFNAINGAYNFKVITDLVTPKIDLSFKIIDQYAQALVLLTSDKQSKALDTVSKTLGSNLDGLIVQYNKAAPGDQVKVGLGSAVAALITLGGDAYIRSQQAGEVRKVVPEADEVIGKMTGNILEFLEPATKGNSKSLEELIKSEWDRVKNSYIQFLGPYEDHILSGAEGEKSTQWGNIEHRRFATLADDQACLVLLQDLDNAEMLRLQCIKAVKSLRAAHAKLMQDIAQKQDLKEIAAELQSYGDDLKNIITTIKSIK